MHFENEEKLSLCLKIPLILIISFQKTRVMKLISELQ